MYYRGNKYTIEVKACKRYLQLNNGYTSDGKFKFGNKIFDNKPHIIVFCIYFKKFREVYYVYGKDILKYLKRKNRKTAYCITIKQMKQYLKPKKYIYPIIEKVDLYG